MRRSIATASILIVAFLGVDEFRSLIQRYAHAAQDTGGWITHGANWLFVDIAIYTFVFGIGGALLGAWFRTRRAAVAWALLVFLSVPLASLLFGPPAPLGWSTHVPVWFEPLFWANFYLPPLAGAAGAAVVASIRQLPRGANAA